MRRIFAVIGIGIGVMVLGMVWSIANMALASIQKDLETSVHHLQWMMNCFGIFISAPLLLMGKLGDAYGRKPFYQTGLIIVVIASIFAADAHHIGTLIACMAFFGLAGSMILPLSQALLVIQFPVEDKPKAVAIWAIFVSLSLAIGPIVGGLLIHYLGWRWIYWYNIPFALLAFLLVTLFVERQKKFTKESCDWSSVIFLSVFIACLIIPIMQGAIWGWDSLLTLGFFALSLLSIITLIVRERKAKAALFRPDLFLNRGFVFSAIPNGCTIGFLWIFFFIIPLYVQNVLGFTALETGTLFLFATIPLFFFSKLVAKAYNRIGAKPFLTIGYLCFIISFILLTQMTPQGWPLYLVTVLFGFGWLFTWGPAISCALSTLPVDQAGIAAGMFNTVQEVSAVTFLSVGGVFFHHAQKEVLLPNIRVLKKAFENKTHDQINSLISNPVEVAREYGGDATIIPWLKNAFLSGFHEIFWFVFVAALFALLFTFLLPKHKAQKNRS